MRASNPNPGYTPGMDESEIDQRLVRDTVGGLESQILERVEQQKQAEADGRVDDADRLQHDVDALHLTLARVAEIIASAGDPQHPTDVLSPEDGEERSTSQLPSSPEQPTV